MKYKPGKFTDVPLIGGMKTWACSYDKDGSRFGIDLVGSDPDQILEDNCDALPGLTVDGQLMSTAPAVPDHGETDGED